METDLLDRFFKIEDSHWWFVGRKRIVLDQLTQLNGAVADLAGNCPLLDLGCGTGSMLADLAAIGPAVGIDLSAAAAAYCRGRGLSVAVASALSMPFPDETFRAVLALDVVEHIKDDGAVLHEIYRVLQPGGVVIITVPALPWLWSSHDAVNHHQRRYMKGALETIVEDAGLEPVKTSYYNSLLLPLATVRKLMHRINGTGDHLDSPPGLVNALLRRVFVAEIPVLRRLDLPLGASLISISRKPG